MRCASTVGRSLLSPSPQDAHRLGFDEKLLAYSEVCRNFRPVFRYFCMERFLDPAVWMEKRLAYTRSVATSSIGTANNNELNKFTERTVFFSFFLPPNLNLNCVWWPQWDTSSAWATDTSRTS